MIILELCRETRCLIQITDLQPDEYHQMHETKQDSFTTIASRPLKKDLSGESSLSPSDFSYISAIPFANVNSSHKIYADAGPVSCPSQQNPELHHKTIHCTFDDQSLDCGTK